MRAFEVKEVSCIGGIYITFLTFHSKNTPTIIPNPRPNKKPDTIITISDDICKSLSLIIYGSTWFYLSTNILQMRNEPVERTDILLIQWLPDLSLSFPDRLDMLLYLLQVSLLHSSEHTPCVGWFL
jgi:hypothetical protein